MRETSDDDDLYKRGRYSLAWDRRADGTLRSPNLQISWYDPDTGHYRLKSTRTADIEQAEEQLDIFFVKRERGQMVCESCGQLMPHGGVHPVADAISNYLAAVRKKDSYKTSRARLAHVTNYLIETDRLGTICAEVTEEWIEEFRDWAFEVPVVSTAGKILGDRSAGTVEGSVRALSAAINHAYDRKDIAVGAAFQARPPSEVSETPTYRADIKTLAAMFNYCLRPPRAASDSDKAYDRQIAYRAALLRFLRISVATWCRPDAAYDVSTDSARRQWHASIRALALNPKGRRQTKKYRPVVPIAQQFAPHLDATNGFYVGVDSIRTAFEGMQEALRLPRDGETGQKLIRRSIAKLARRRLGETDWIEGQMMLGHRVHSKTSDIYAAFEAGYLTRALEVTESIIDDIEKLAPGAFHRGVTGMRLIEGGLKC